MAFAESIDTQLIDTQLIDTPLLSLNATSTDLIAANATSTEPVIGQSTPLEVTPTLNSTNNSYLITEDAEIILEFYDESDVLLNEIKELENSLLLLEELEYTLDEIDHELTAEASTEITIPTLGFIHILIPFADAAPQTMDDESRIEIANTKQQIQELKDRFESLKAANGLDELTTKELKAGLKSLIGQLKVTTLKISQTSHLDMGKNVEKKISNIESIGDVDDDTVVQKGTWNGTEEQITVSIYDARGDQKNISTQIEKLRDGKFDIKFSPDASTKPVL